MEESLVPGMVLDFERHREYGCKYKEDMLGEFAQWRLYIVKEHKLTAKEAAAIIGRFVACVLKEVERSNG